MILRRRARAVGMINESTVYIYDVNEIETNCIKREALTPIPAMSGFASNSPNVTLP